MWTIDTTTESYLHYLQTGSMLWIGEDRMVVLARGTEGNDSYFGGADREIVHGYGGNDTIFGGGGSDLLAGDAGDDYLSGGNGQDELLGHDGNDRLYGDAGHDSLFGGDGTDWLEGGSGVDRLYGGLGNDILFGGADDDQLDGGAGADAMTGGAGADRFIVEGGDVIVDFVNGEDKIKLALGGAYAIWNTMESGHMDALILDAGGSLIAKVLGTALTPNDFVA